MATPANRFAANTDPIGSSTPLRAANERNAAITANSPSDPHEEGQHEEARAPLHLHHEPGHQEADEEEDDDVEAIEREYGSDGTVAFRRHEPGSKPGRGGEEGQAGDEVEDTVEHDDHGIPSRPVISPSDRTRARSGFTMTSMREAIGGARPGRES